MSSFYVLFNVFCLSVSWTANKKQLMAKIWCIASFLKEISEYCALSLPNKNRNKRKHVQSCKLLWWQPAWALVWPVTMQSWEKPKAAVCYYWEWSMRLYGINSLFQQHRSTHCYRWSFRHAGSHLLHPFPHGNDWKRQVNAQQCEKNIKAKPQYLASAPSAV